MIDELLRMAPQLGDASSHLHQAAEALSGPAVPMPPTLGLMAEGQVRVREQLLLAELEAPAAAKSIDVAANDDEPAREGTTREQQREEYYDNLERFRDWATHRGQPFQVAMRAALAAYMSEQPTLPPVRRKGPRGRPPKAAAPPIIESKPTPTATTAAQPANRSPLLGKKISAEHRAAIAAGRQRSAAAKKAKQAAHVPIVPPAPAAKHESRPRFAGVDAQPINVMRVLRKDED